jgi:predicted signal transduction protein with EAL and GGDEF domain
VSDAAGESGEAITPPSRGSSRTLLALGAALVLAILGFVAYGGWAMRVQALASAQTQLSNLSVVLEDQTSRALHGADLVLRETAERLQRLGDPVNARGSAPLYTLLRERALLLQQVDGVVVLDRRGLVMLDTRQFPAPMTSHAEDPVFLAHARGGEVLHVGPGACESAANCAFTLSRRVTGLRGEFVGVVIANVRVDYFRDLYRGIDLGSAGAVVLRSREGEDLAGYSSEVALRGRIEQRGLDASWLRGIVRLPGAAERMTVVRALPEYPLRVDTSMSRAAVLAGWFEQMALLVVGAAIVSGLLGGLVVMLARQFARRERDEQAMRRLVEVDTLTGVASRNQFERRLAQAIAQFRAEHPQPAPAPALDAPPADGEAARKERRRRNPPGSGPLGLREIGSPHEDNGPGVGLLLIDLDRFKTINDTLGHRIGDELLRQVARRLLACVPDGAMVARLGGDEFVMLVEGAPGHERQAGRRRGPHRGDRRAGADIDRPDVVHELASEVLAVLARPFTLDRGEYHVTASIGIARYPGDADSADALLANADIAMYRAKELGKNTAQAYSAHMSVQAGERLALESALRQALARDEFLLHYQPKLDLRTGRLTGMEALVRWQHPQRGLVSPASFIPLAEEIGVIVPLGRWVLETACRQMRTWQQQGLPPLRVAVNLSARQFAQSGLVTQVREVLQDTGLDASALELEITESMVMRDPEQAVKVLGRLKAMGIALSIDDFGTGYSSLGYLKRFPIDGLKIDRSFIKDVPGDAEDVAITQTIVAMAHALKLKVVAEGVETPAQLEFLRANHCDEMQGYLLARPMPAQDFAAFVRERTRATGAAPV